MQNLDVVYNKRLTRKIPTPKTLYDASTYTFCCWFTASCSNTVCFFLFKETTVSRISNYKQKKPPQCYVWIKDKNEYNRVSYFFVSIIFFPNGSVSNPQKAATEKKKKKSKTCMQNQPTADGNSSIFISICATLGNFSKNMLIQSFLSDSEIHKAPLSKWSLYFPRLGLSWMFTFSLLQILASLKKKGSFTRNNLCCHYPQMAWRHGSSNMKKRKKKKVFFPFTVPCICWHLFGENAEKLK